MIQAELIGGPCDGERHRMEAPYPYIEVPLSDNGPLLTAGDVAFYPQYRTGRYRRSDAPRSDGGVIDYHWQGEQATE